MPSNSGQDDFAFLDATAQAELVRTKQVTPAELVDAAIARIERLNPALNAVVTPLFDQAREAARGELPEGPFTGVPYLLKDLMATLAGVRMTSGSVFLRDHVAREDSELVRRLKRAGLIVVGKTNTPEFGLLPTTEPKLFGATHNPWNLGHTTGGSSGGSAAGVASGMVPMAHANDGGGSIRIPASCCGLFGLKPTRARNPLGPRLGDGLSGLVAEHAVTRSVRDSAALLDATSGPDLGDPYWAPPPERPFAEEVGRDPGRLRIAVATRAVTGLPVHPDCLAAAAAAAKLCESLGHTVEEADPGLDGERLDRIFGTLWSAGAAASVDGSALMMGREAKPEEFEPLTWAMAERGRERTAAEYLMAVAGAQAVSREVARFFADYDALLTPTLAEPPVPLGTFDSTPANPLQGMQRAAQFVPFTPIFNITGQPAMSLPLYWNDASLPVGVQFAGRFGDEGTLFRLAAQLETARRWSQRKPPISG